MFGYLDMFYAKTAGHFGKSIIGFKLFPRQLPAETLHAVIAHPGHRVVLIERRNILQAAVSYQIARQTGQWNVRNKKKLGWLSIDPDGVEKFIATYREGLTEARDVLKHADARVMDLTYEDLYTHATVNNILHFLGAKGMRYRNDRTWKLNSFRRYLRIANLFEVDRRFGNDKNGRLLRPAQKPVALVARKLFCMTSRGPAEIAGKG